MTLFKKIIALCLACLLMLPCALPVQATQTDTNALVRQLVNYYHYYQEDASLDYELILEQIRAQDPALAYTWANILSFWHSLNTDMPVYSDVLPDDLPEDDSLCIVVMGYHLESNGGIRPELEARLKVTLASALKYPNAYILCTGGGTASKNSKVTEAGQMQKWLVQNGIASDRIIVEDNAMSTIQNAIYGCQLLYQNYPQIRSLAVITSDYHIYRSCLYFHTQAALDAYNAGIEPIRVVANATCRINPNSPTELSTQTEGIGMLTGMKDVHEMSQPWLTHLHSLQIAGATEYAMGSELNLQITAFYSNGYSRDVTSRCKYTGFDFGKSGFQTVTVTYEEGLARKVATFDIYMIPPEGNPLPEEEKPTLPVPDPPVLPTPEVVENTPDLKKPLIFAGVCLVLLIALLIYKDKQARKRRRRKKPSFKLS